MSDSAEETEPPSPVAARLREARHGAGMTLDDVARLAGMSSSGVWKVENRTKYPRGDILAKLCEIYQCSADWVLYGTPAAGEPGYEGWSDFLDEAPDTMSSWERAVLASIRFPGWSPPMGIYGTLLTVLRTHRDMADKAEKIARSAIRRG
jgi:transcriptional regulator with XRE-family HTH domain